MRLDSRDSNRDFRESENKYFNARAGILKYSGLFQVLIGLHWLFLVLLVFSGVKKGSDTILGFMAAGFLMLLFSYIFYQYFKYKKRWTCYIFLVSFGFLCIISFFAMFGDPFILIVFIIYCLILWYLYESLKSSSNTQ